MVRPSPSFRKYKLKKKRDFELRSVGLTKTDFSTENRPCDSFRVAISLLRYERHFVLARKSL